MPLFSFSLWIVITIALVSECDAVLNSAGNPWYKNLRAAGFKHNNKEELALPGAEIFISSSDSFDFVSSPGYSISVKELVEQDAIFLASSDQTSYY